MNVLMQNIYEQPSELKRVLFDLTEKRKEQVVELANKMRISKEIVLTSMGSAIYSMMPMYEALVEAGFKNVKLIETAELIHHPERLDKGNFYVIMSRSGESREVGDFAIYLNKNGYISLSITMTPDSTLGTNTTYMLHDVSSYDAIVCIKAYSTMTLCGLLLASVMDKGKIDKELVDKLNKSFDWMEENKEKIYDQLKAIPYFESVDGFYMISRGFGINMMRSGSLWVEETGKLMANVMSIDNFYHGPMEVIRWQSRVPQNIIPIFLDAEPDPRSKMIWEEACRFKPENIYIGSEGERADEMPGAIKFIYPEFGLKGAYTSLVIALYLQLLSFEVPLCRGIEPGAFLDEGWIVK